MSIRKKKVQEIIDRNEYPYLPKYDCPEELKRAYAAIKEVREALLCLERKLGEADAKIVVGVDYDYGSGYAVTGRQMPDGRIEVIKEEVLCGGNGWIGPMQEDTKCPGCSDCKRKQGDIDMELI